MKEFIEIPFGAKDSELCGWEYTIPEGFVASIENGKIVVKKEESDDERIRKELYDFCMKCSNGDTLVNQQADFKRWAAWLEKQGEQKEKVIDFKASDWYVSKIDGKIHNMYYVDKVESKFKVGDWIVRNYPISGTFIYKVVGVKRIADKTYGYKLDDGTYFSGSWESSYHLWTLKDAKDGDVLVDRLSKDNIIILYKGINPKLSVLAYCGWNGYNLSIKTNGLGYGGLDNTNYLPATKEQQDLLFQKMKEAGYEWDAEKKELKKSKRMISAEVKEALYNKPAWSEEDEEKLNQLHNLIVKKAYEEYEIDIDGETLYGKYAILDNWLKSLKERMKGE